MYASNPWPLESMLLSMLLEHQKALIVLTERLRLLESMALKGGPGKVLTEYMENTEDSPTLPSSAPPNPL